jgi:hypothetical protein
VRFFPLLDYQHLTLAFCLGLAMVIVIYLSFRYRNDPRIKEKDGPGPVSPDMTGGEGHLIPPVLILLYAGVVVWTVFYVIFAGIRGGPM